MFINFERITRFSELKYLFFLFFSSFYSLVREVIQQYKQDFRLQTEALNCLQEASEQYLVQLFEDANLACYHRTRVTVDVKDMRLIQLLRGAADPGRRF